MKFKTSENEQSPGPKKVGMSTELYNKFIDLIQFEIEKLNLINSAQCYFFKEGQMAYKKFFAYIEEQCKKVKSCLILHLSSNMEEIPEFKIPAQIKFEDLKEPFVKLAEMEDSYEEKLNNLIDIAFVDKNWKSFYYLLKKLDTIDHLCCRAVVAIENKCNVLNLLPACEQHTLEK